MKIYDLDDIVRKFIGPTYPTGNHSGDRTRLENLEELISLVERYVEEINDIAKFKDDNRASTKALGVKAQNSINEILEILGAEL